MLLYRGGVEWQNFLLRLSLNWTKQLPRGTLDAVNATPVMLGSHSGWLSIYRSGRSRPAFVKSRAVLNVRGMTSRSRHYLGVYDSVSLSPAPNFA